MKLCTTLIITFCLVCSAPIVSAEAANAPKKSAGQINWLSVHWPPWMYTKGPNKGKGPANVIMQKAIERLPEYEHKMVEMNWARFWNDVSDGKHVCNVLAIKKPDRESLAAFSKPTAIFLHNAVILKKSTKEKLGNPETISLNEILNIENLLGTVESARSYGEIIDKIIADNKGNPTYNLRKTSGKSDNLIKMIHYDRIDYTIDYPMVTSVVLKSNGLESDITSIPIEENKKYDFTRIACPDNDWGNELLEKYNSFLPEIVNDPDIIRSLESVYDNEDQLKIFRKYYKNLTDYFKNGNSD